MGDGPQTKRLRFMSLMHVPNPPTGLQVAVTVCELLR